jgi:hypothetical protein
MLELRLSSTNRPRRCPLPRPPGRQRPLLGADPRAQAWQAVIDDYAARFAAGPVRKESERAALTQAARALADATMVQSGLGDELIAYLESQDIDPAP